MWLWIESTSQWASLWCSPSFPIRLRYFVLLSSVLFCSVSNLHACALCVRCVCLFAFGTFTIDIYYSSCHFLHILNHSTVNKWRDVWVWVFFFFTCLPISLTPSLASASEISKYRFEGNQKHITLHQFQVIVSAFEWWILNLHKICEQMSFSSL